MTLTIKVESDALVEGSKECGPRTISLQDFDGPLPLEGNGIKSQTNHKGSIFNAFLLLKKYCNNANLDLAINLATDSNDFCFMVLLTTHITTQHKEDATKHDTKARTQIKHNTSNYKKMQNLKCITN
jgi:hypothetical protein